MFVCWPFQHHPTAPIAVSGLAQSLPACVLAMEPVRIPHYLCYSMPSPLSYT